MRGPHRIAAATLLALAATCPISGYIGFVVGVPTPGAEFGNCEDTNLLGAEWGGLSMSVEINPSRILSVLNGGSFLSGCNGWSEGSGYDCPGGNFHEDEPDSGDDSVWVIVGMYPESEPATQHRGWVFLDITRGTDLDLGSNVTQALAPGSTEPGYWPDGFLIPPEARRALEPPRLRPAVPMAALYPSLGISYRFRAVAEFGRDWPGSVLTCRIGGDPEGTGFDDRALAGYNIYRLMDVPAQESTPDHYLKGPDLMSGTGDEGWVAFYPSGIGAGGSGLDLSNPGGPPWENDNDPNDCFEIEGLDWDGDTDIDHEDDAILVYQDRPGLAPNAPTPAELATRTFSYVFQPVLKGEPGPDTDGDTIPDLDLDGDTVPEFISPGGIGLGLTADIAGHRTILISPEVTHEPVRLRGPDAFPGP
jgi:hypothetical protein